MSKKTDIEAIYPLSHTQEGLLFHTLYTPERGLYLTQVNLTLSGNLNVPAFNSAWQQIMDRHPVLRTLFVWEGREKPLQIVRKQVNLPWEQLDWSEVPEVEQQERMKSFLEEDRDRGLNLSQAPLMRLSLIRTSKSRWQLIWTHHHLLLDGWSVFLILKEVFNMYESQCQGKSINLERTRPYKDYISYLQKQDLSEAEKFWQETLDGFIAPTPIGSDQANEKIPEQKHAYIDNEVQLSEATTGALESLARQHRLTINTIVQGAWAILLSRYSDKKDVVFGTTVSGRPADFAGIESMVGLFINTLPARVQVSPEESLPVYLKKIQDRQIEMLRYDYSPLVKVHGWSQVPRDLSLFNSIMVFENYPVEDFLSEHDQGLKIEKMRAVERTNYPLNVIVLPGSNLTLKFSYDRSNFSDSTIARMGGHIKTLLESIVAKPDQRLSELPLLTEAEQNQVLVQWNDAKTDYPRDKCVNQLFEEQAEKTPDAIAVIFDDEHVTYGELNRRANQLARYLRTKGVGPEVLVGLYIERSLEMVVGLLGIIKAGGVYIPLDPSYPMQRITYMLQDSEAAVLVTQERLIEKLPTSSMQIVRLDSDWNEIEREQPDNLTPSAGPQDLSYVIYTSGSTGKPKGVAIPHGALVNFLWSMKQEPGLTGKDVLLSVTTLSFDIAALELFLPLIVGAQIVLVSRDTAMDARQLIAQIEGRGVTVMQATPATWRILLQADWKGSPDLKILIGGEALSEELATDLLPRCAELWNMYGPTETTIWSTVWKVASDRDRILIGRPIANTQVYILDRNLQPVPFGVAGELYIGGDGLAREYLKRPELTSERFVVNPFQKFPMNGGNASKLIYKTGDLSRWLPDGQIECLGRIDHQVKIRGFRIELGEIESVLSEDPGVAQCVVVAREDTPGNKRLVAYIVAHNEAPAIDALRQQLKKELADYMIPSAFVMMDTLPLTPNGKVDRKALPAPDAQRPDLENTFIGPRTSTEELMAGIWCELLKLKQVGINDNFFELGGHSLMTVQVQGKLQKALNRDIKITDIFNYPTIAELAERLIKEEEGEKARFEEFYTLLPVQTKGTQHPLFFLHLAQMRHHLPKYLGKDQPLYALMAQGLDGKRARYTTTKELTEHYIKEIRAIQPSGPYYLGGYCWGGTFAYDIAQQLIQQGEDVGLLFLLEPALATKPVYSSQKPVQNPENSANRHMSALSQLPLHRKITYITERIISRVKGKVKRLYIQGLRESYFRTGRDLPSAYRLDYIFDIVAQASLDFVQNTYPNDVVIVSAERGNHQGADWSNLAEGKVTVHELVDVDHIKMVEEQYIDIWGKWLSMHIRKAQTTHSEVKRHKVIAGA